MAEPTELQYRTLLASELDAVEALLLETLRRNSAPLVEALQALITGGGKRLRPALVLLSAHLCEAEPADAVNVAAAVEMLHTATLIHDDLIDGARLRRGMRTLNTNWSSAATVLAGDIAFAWAAQLIARVQNLVLMPRLAETLEIICEGELDQLLRGRGVLPTQPEYESRIFAKTASLFALSTEAGAILAGRSKDEQARLWRFGRLLGEAFQIADDVLDVMGSDQTLGKPAGNDLRQGLATLPVLRYAARHPADDRVTHVLAGDADEATLAALLADLRHDPAPDWAMAQAEARICEALPLLADYPDTAHRRAMEEIARFAVRRRY